ncbi:MAG TPA: hypothetical protein VGN83_29295 [Falsiroseomonas sp.]|jgi:hypothetical protein|nr:hypothetical protein [Falsiroseomonas sp.]
MMKRRDLMVAGAGTLALPAYLSLTSSGALAQGAGRTLLIAPRARPRASTVTRCAPARRRR